MMETKRKKSSSRESSSSEEYLVNDISWKLIDKYFTDNIIESHRGISDVVETYTRHGEVILPHFDSMVDIMKNVVLNFDNQSNKFFNQIPQVVKDYDWQLRTNDALDKLISRIGIDMFENSGFVR